MEKGYIIYPASKKQRALRRKKNEYFMI